MGQMSAKKRKGHPKKRVRGASDEVVVRRRPRSRKGRQRTPIPLLLLLVGGIITMSSMALPWGGLDVDTKIGIIPVTLDADVYVHKVKYEADLSGTEGIISTGGDMSRQMSEERIYLTGLGDFQETIGFVKGSSKYKNHTIELYTLPDNNRAKVSIATLADTIPWWPVGVSQDITLTVKVVEEPVNITHVLIKKVWLELHREIDGTDKHKVVWEQEPGAKLKKLGDSMVYETKVTIDEDYGKFSIVGRAQLELIDINGDSNRGLELKSFTDNPKMINLWTVSTQRTIRLGLMIAAFPLTMVAGILLIMGGMTSFLGKRYAWKLAMAGAVLAILSVLFFISGVYTLIDLTGYIDWFSWDPIGISIPMAGFTMGLIGAVFAFVERPKGRQPRKRKMLAPEEGEELGPAKGVEAMEEVEEVETGPVRRKKKGRKKGKGKAKKGV